MPAQFLARWRPRCPRLYLPWGTEIVEGDGFEYEIWLRNTGESPFPPKPMTISVRWEFPNAHGHRHPVQLTKDQLLDKDWHMVYRADAEVQAPGYAQFFVEYDPHDPAAG